MILVIDCSLRDNSRTKDLANHLLTHIKDEVIWLKPESINLKPLNRLSLEDRGNNKYCDEQIKTAKLFASAKQILFIAPYYDLSFPSSLKVFIENITLPGITFTYDNGVPHGLCNAEKAYYVATAGGSFDDRFGYEYIKELCMSLYGIKECLLFKAECLDEFPDKEKEIIESSKRKIDAYFSE